MSPYIYLGTSLLHRLQLPAAAGQRNSACHYARGLRCTFCAAAPISSASLTCFRISATSRSVSGPSIREQDIFDVDFRGDLDTVSTGACYFRDADAAIGATAGKFAPSSAPSPAAETHAPPSFSRISFSRHGISSLGQVLQKCYTWKPGVSHAVYGEFTTCRRRPQQCRCFDAMMDRNRQ